MDFSTMPPGLKLFWDHCNEVPEAIALVEVGGRHWSRRELGEASCRVRNVLEARGVCAANAVAIIAPNCAEFLIAYLGITMLGARAVPVNHHLTAEEVRHVMRVTAATCVFMHESLDARLSAAIVVDGRTAERFVMGRDPQGAFACELCHDQSPVAPLPSRLGRTMSLTSATTGRPKAIACRPEYGYEHLARLIGFRESMGTGRDSGVVHLCASTLYHAGPLEGAVVTLHMGNVVALMRTWDAHAALQAIQDLRVTEAFLVPIMLVQLVRVPEEKRRQYDLSSLRLLVHAGAPCPVDVKHQIIQWLGPIVCEGYGASEGGGTFVSATDWLRYPGTVGRPIPGADIRILDQRGIELPPFAEGLIYIRPYTGDRFEYVGDPEATARSYVGDHFTVGDIGYLNDEGFLFIRDRAINMIIRGGANIYPAEVESVLLAHPYVADCAVVGRAHAEFGESVHAIVQPSGECALSEPELKSELIRFAYRRLAPAKLPSSFEFVPALPRDPNGKLLKRRIASSGSTPHRTDDAVLAATP